MKNLTKRLIWYNVDIRLYNSLNIFIVDFSIPRIHDGCELKHTKRVNSSKKGENSANGKVAKKKRKKNTFGGNIKYIFIKN